MSRLMRLRPFLILLVLGAALAFCVVPVELEQMRWEIPGMLDTYPLEQLLRPILLGTLCLIPALVALGYAFMGTMDRYVTRNFVTYFLMCTLILLLIYILADFTDNINRFRERFENPLAQTGVFYGTQLPMFLYQILPYTLLMGALWCLSKLSGTCELTGMLQSGRSLLRVCMPIFFVTVMVSLMYGICGFHWAPNGSMYRQNILKRQTGKEPPALVYRSEVNARIWRVTHPAPLVSPGDPMRDVVIEQFEPGIGGRLLKRYMAESAVWDKASSTWTLNRVYIRDVSDPDKPQVTDEFHESVVYPFNEKPYQIISPSQRSRVDALGTSTLYEYIKKKAGSREDRYKMRTEWHVRIARIFSCVVLVLLAVPSAVTFQRRGTMKGIGIAVLLAALMLFFYRVFPSLGEAGVIQAWISAWIPNVMYMLIAVYLYRVNLANRSLREWWHDLRHIRL